MEAKNSKAFCNQLLYLKKTRLLLDSFKNVIFAVQKIQYMQLAEIVSVSQMPGIFQVIGKKQDGLIVKSLVDSKTQFISGRTHMFSTLDNITIYTTDEPIALKEVLAEMKKQFAKNPPVASNASEADLKKYFGSIIPAYDTEKVYVSDMKKLVKWYAILDSNKLIDELLNGEEVVAETNEDVTDATEKPKKATKKAVADDAKDVKPTKVKAATTKTKTAAPKTNVAPKKITTPRKAS